MTTIEQTTQTPKSKRIVSASQRRAEIVIATLFLVTAAASYPGGFRPGFDSERLRLSGQDFSEQGSRRIGCPCCGRSTTSGSSSSRCLRFACSENSMKPSRSDTWLARIIEGTIMMVGIAATLLLIPLSQEFIKAGAPQGSWFLTVGDILKQARFLGLTGLSLPMLGLGGLLFTWMLFRFRLVPRVISVVGLIGYALVLFGSIAGWFGLIDVAPGGNGTIFALPVAAFEIILLPFWLLFKGFKIPDAPEGIGNSHQS